VVGSLADTGLRFEETKNFAGTSPPFFPRGTDFVRHPSTLSCTSVYSTPPPLPALASSPPLPYLYSS